MKKIGIFIIVIGLLMVGFASIQSVTAAPEANTGIVGRIVDGKTAQPWGYGAEVIIIQTSGTNVGLKGSAVLAANGTFAITYPTATNTGMTDPLSLCGTGAGQMGDCTTVENFATLQLMVTFRCDWNTGNGTRPMFNSSTDASCPLTPLGGGTTALVGLPGNFQYQYTDTFAAGTRDLGDFDTNRGPTAISLEAVHADSNTISPLAIAGIMVILFGTGLMIYRRRQEIA